MSDPLALAAQAAGGAAAARRRKGVHDPVLESNLVEAQLTNAISKVLEGAPPLTVEAAARVHALLDTHPRIRPVAFEVVSA